MWSQVSDGQVIRILPNPVSLTVGDITYPKVIFTRWSKPELKDIGIYPYREISADRYQHSGTISYEVKSDEVVGSYASPTDMDFEVLKANMLINANHSASALLARDDWMAIREVEGGTAMPDNITDFREAIREESNNKETAIKALSDLDAVKLYEATPYTETRKKEIIADNGDVSYGEEYEFERHINISGHYFTEDPLAKDDPAFVSLVKK